MIKRKITMLGTRSQSLPVLLAVVMLLSMIMVGTIPLAAMGGGLDDQAPYWPVEPTPFLTASDVTANSVNLNWSAALDDVGVTGYRVYMNNQTLATVASTAYAVNNLSPATSYDFQVEALDAAGNISQGGPTTIATMQAVYSSGGGGGGSSSGSSSRLMTIPIIFLNSNPPSPGPQLSVLPGQKARYLVKVEIDSSLIPAAGLNLSVTGTGAPSNDKIVFTVPVKKSPIGLEMIIDTTSMTPGTYNWNLNADGTGLSASFQLVVFNAAAFSTVFGNYDSSGFISAANPLTITKQGPINLYYMLRNNTTAQAVYSNEAFQLGVRLQSDNLAAVQVFNADRYNTPFSYEIHAVDDGSANISLLAPDGSTIGTPQTITVDVPSDPYIRDVTILPSEVSNAGNTDLSFTATGSRSIGIGCAGNADMSWIFDKGDWSSDRLSYSAVAGRVYAGEMPGTYIAYAMTDGTNSIPTAERVTTLTIVNDASKGQISGNICNFNQSGSYQMDSTGTLEIYALDNATTPVLTKNIWSMTSAYTLPYLAPGSYKVKFTKGMSGTSEWYPNAKSYAEAGQVTVTAGQEAKNISFFFVASSSPVITSATASYAWHSGGTAVDPNTSYINAGANLALYDIDINQKATTDTLDTIKITTGALMGSSFDPFSALKPLVTGQEAQGVSFYVYNPYTLKYSALGSEVVAGWVYDSNSGTYSAELKPRLVDSLANRTAIGSGFTDLILKVLVNTSDSTAAGSKFYLQVNSIKMLGADSNSYEISLIPPVNLRTMEVRSEPSVIWYNIPENKGSIAEGTPLSIAFSGPMNNATINKSSFTLLDSSNQAVAANVYYMNISPLLNYPVHVAWLTPTTQLDGNYTLQVANTVYGNNGVSLNSPWLHSFTTGTTPINDYLQIYSRNPLQGASSVDLGAPVSIVFENTLDISTANATNIMVTKADGRPVEGGYVISVLNGNRGVMISFPRYLKSKTGYLVTIGTGVKDISGKSLAAPESWNFSTVSQFLPMTGYRVMIDKGNNDWIAGTNLTSIDPSMGVYYYYSGQTMRIKVVPKNTASNPLAGSTLYASIKSLEPNNTTPYKGMPWDVTNQCWNLVYTLPNDASLVGPCPITIGTAQSQLVAVMMAVMNINPKDFGMGLGGATTDWSTLTDYTAITDLTFEKYDGQNIVAKLVLPGPINTCELDEDGNPVNATDMQKLGQSLEMAYGRMSIDSAVGALAGFNKPATLTLYNIQSNGTPGVRYLPGSGDPTVLIQPGGAVEQAYSNGKISSYNWNATDKILTLAINSWSGYEVIPNNGTAPVSGTDFISFNLPGQVKSTLDPVSRTITISVPANTDLTNLIASFSLSEGATTSVNSIEQISGTTANNFSTQLAYTVKASDESIQVWTVKVSKEGCFIATAAFGSYLDPHVWALRQFRDNVLLHSVAGRWFVKEYYQHSPAIATVIAQHDGLRMMTRILLTPIILAVEYPQLAAMILAGLLLLLIAAKIRPRKRLVQS